MIRINLLPPELRKLEHTPPARRITIFLGTFFVMIALAAAAWVWNEIRILDGVIADLNSEKTIAAEAVKDYPIVQAEVDKYRARKNAVESIKAKRKFRWSKQLDTLADVVDATPRLWLSTVKFADGSPSGGERLPASLAGRSIDYYMSMRDSRTSTADKRLYSEVEQILKEKFINSGQFGFLANPSTFTLEKQEKYIEGFSHKFNILLLGLGAAKPVTAGPPGAGS